jgi:hypothetical protein
LGVVSLTWLIRIPGLPNCPAIFWPTASASLRLYCAQAAAGKDTVNDLLYAIKLLDQLPNDHPMRDEVNRYIQLWSVRILELGEETFQKGDLEKAIAIAHSIPASVANSEAINDQITQWQDTWNQANAIYQEAEDALRQANFQQAFTISVRLLDIDNDYWQTTKRDELQTAITVTRQESSSLTRARQLANSGGTAGILQAIDLAQAIPSQSYVYGKAQDLIDDLGDDLLSMAQAALDRQDYDEAIAIIRQIPDDLNLDAESRDFLTLAEAQSQAWNGTTQDLESAIIQAQRIDRTRPLYTEAQNWIRQWRLEIQDVQRLDTARQLAQPGTIGALQAAIAEANLVPADNPRRDDAQALVADWTADIQRIEDQPFLDRAEQLARGGNTIALQAAIDEASQIQAGRALYSTAQDRIADWTSQVQQIQDQPYLDQARQLANQGDYGGAIAVAERIQPGRALYGEAQADIQEWEAQIVGRDRLSSAYAMANNGTPNALLNAIQLAGQVPSNSPSYPEAIRAMNQWSYDLLSLARTQSQYDLSGAIATASSIPSFTEAYAAAQLQIQSWQAVVNPSLPSENVPSSP